MTTVGWAKSAVVFEVVNEVVAAQSDVARIPLTSIASSRFWLGVRTALEAHKLLVSIHLTYQTRPYLGSKVGAAKAAPCAPGLVSWYASYTRVAFLK